MNRAFLLLGGNMGNRFFFIFNAISDLNVKIGSIIRSSSFYITSAWGNENQPDFLNVAVELETSLSPTELLSGLKEIESKYGPRTGKWEPRQLDIDILFYNEEVIHTGSLNVPHPELGNRRFALVPLCEIAPGIVHPITGKKASDMLTECEDSLNVCRI